jgi:hypothetical protein
VQIGSTRIRRGLIKEANIAMECWHSGLFLKYRLCKLYDVFGQWPMFQQRNFYVENEKEFLTNFDAIENSLKFE